MLAVSSRKYFLPQRQEDGYWQLYRRDNAEEIINTRTFNYTIEFDQVDIDADPRYGKFKATFIYDGTSVKPNMRAIRRYGADRLQPIVSKLSCNGAKDKCELRIAAADLIKQMFLSK